MQLEFLRDSDSYKRVRSLLGREQISSHRFRADLDTALFSLMTAPNLQDHEILTPDEVPLNIGRLLQYSRLAYISGGFDLAFHHILIMESMNEILPADVRVLIGIEPNSFIEHKGRMAIAYQEDRLRTMARILKKNGKLAGAIYLPDQLSDTTTATHYDNLIKCMGLYKRPNVYHLYTTGDPATNEKRDRMIDIPVWCELPKIGETGTMSTTDILRE